MKKVLVMFTVTTEDYGKEEFKHEIKSLINDIDPESNLEQFEMQEVSNYFDLINDIQLTDIRK